MIKRQCSRNGCARPAVATLTFAYQDSTAVVGPLATQATPGAYDLCTHHAERMTVPQGWEIIRLEAPEPVQTGIDDDELLALARAVREIGFADDPGLAPETTEASMVELGRKGHLRILADADRVKH